MRLGSSPDAGGTASPTCSAPSRRQLVVSTSPRSARRDASPRSADSRTPSPPTPACGPGSLRLADWREVLTTALDIVTRQRQARLSCSRDHPRTRGEHLSFGRAGAVFRGPSPHARGALLGGAGDGAGGGTIPARAGSTLLDLHVYHGLRPVSSTSSEADQCRKRVTRNDRPSAATDPPPRAGSRRLCTTPRPTVARTRRVQPPPARRGGAWGLSPPVSRDVRARPRWRGLR